MRIDIHGQHVEVTPALRDYVESKFARLQKHYEQPLDVRATLAVDKDRQTASATINAAGFTVHAEADGVDMYAAIDLLVDKLDRLVLKHKEKQVDTHRRAESLARSGELG